MNTQNKIPVGYMIPAIIADGGSEVVADYPVTTWIPDWNKCLVNTLDSKYLYPVENITSPEMGIVNQHGQHWVEFFKVFLQGNRDFLESKGPGFHYMNTRIFQEHLDWRPWYELEKDYQQFLVVNQACWVEHILDYWPKITEEGIKNAGCSKLLECLRNGRAKMIITIPWESGWWADWNYVEWKPALDRLRIPTDNIILLCPQSKNIEEFGKKKYGIRFKTFEHFERYPWDLSRNIERCKQELEAAKNQFLAFNRSRAEDRFKIFCHIGNPQEYRMGLYTLLHNLLNPQDVLVHMSSMAYSDQNFVKEQYNLAINEVERCRGIGRLPKEEYDRFKQALCFNRDLKHIRFRVDPVDNFAVDPEEKDNYNHVLLDPWRKQGLIEVFGETRCLNGTSILEDRDGNHCWFITEKSTKPISSLKPFICLANPGYLKYLRSQGYKTFSKWWDESYDEEPNWVDRELKVLRVLEDLQSRPIADIYDMLEDMEEVLIHNFNLRASKIFTRDLDFIDLLQSFLNENFNRVLPRRVTTRTTQLV